MNEIELDRGLPWADAEQLLADHQAEAAAAAAGLASPRGGAMPAVLASVPAAPEEGLADAPDQQPNGAALASEQQEEQQQQEQQQRSPGEAPAPRRSNGTVKQEAQPEQQEPAPLGKRQQPGEDADAAEAPPAAKRIKTSGGAAADAGGGVIDLTVSGSDAPQAQPAERGGGSGSDSEEVVEVVGGGPEPKWGSGFYRATKEGINHQASLCPLGADGGAAAPHMPTQTVLRLLSALPRLQVHVLLALQVPDSKPPTFAVHRPATGRSRQLMTLQVRRMLAPERLALPRGPVAALRSPCHPPASLHRQPSLTRMPAYPCHPTPLRPPGAQELKDRYRQLRPAVCRPVWDKAYEAADAVDDGERRGGPPVRKKRLHILGGAVMHSWSVVQAALARHVKPSERRMRVLRIATTDDPPTRLVGILIPSPAVAEVEARLEGQGGAAGSDGGEEWHGGSSADGEERAPADGATGGRGGKHHRRHHRHSSPRQQQQPEAAAAAEEGGSGGVDGSRSRTDPSPKKQPTPKKKEKGKKETARHTPRRSGRLGKA